MARSVSRSRKRPSKSPGRVKRHATPKSEPKKMMSPKSEPKKKTTPRAPSRSRSASRGRKVKKNQKQPTKSVSRSRSYGRGMVGGSEKLETSSTKTSPKGSAEVKKTLSSSSSSSKTPAAKPRATKTPPMKSAVSKPTSMLTLSLKQYPTSTEREARLVERKVYTSTPVEPEFRQRLLRNVSSSRSPTQVRIKKPADSFYTSLYNRVCGTVCAAGGCVCDNTRAFWNKIVENRREIFVTFLLLIFVAVLTYFVLYTEPAKTRAFIHSIPGQIYTWYKKLFARK